MSEKHIITINGENYVLPIPMPWEIVDGQKISTVDLMNFGEVENGSRPAPRTISLSQFFPSYNFGFVSNTEFRNKWEYVKAFKASLVSTLDSAVVERPDGTREKLVRKVKDGEIKNA